MPTFDRPSYRLTFGGNLLSGAEEWQTGVRFAPPPGTPESALVAQLGTISLADIWEDLAEVWQTGGNFRWSTATSIEWVKLAVLKTDGRYAGSPAIHEQHVSGGYPLTFGEPPQLATVVTLATGSSFGRAQKGRMYWPAPADFLYKLDKTTGQVPESQVGELVSTVSRKLKDVEGEVSTVGVPVTMAVMSGLAPGTTRSVTQLGVGRILDTQRRRRGDLVEDYVYEPFGG